MRSFLSNRTNTNTLIESVKIKSVYQSASLIAQDISFQLRNNPISFRSIFIQIMKDIPLIMPKGVEGICICCSGRLGGAEITRTECGKYGKHLVMYLIRKSIMLLRKYLLVMEFQVSKCRSHIVKIRKDVIYPKRMKYSKYSKCRCSRGREPDGTQLGFVRYGTKSCRAGCLSYRAIEAVRRATIGQFHHAMSGQF
jgi:hypothetical protein